MDSATDEHLDGSVTGSGAQIRLQVAGGGCAQFVEREQIEESD